VQTIEGLTVLMMGHRRCDVTASVTHQSARFVPDELAVVVLVQVSASDESVSGLVLLAVATVVIVVLSLVTVDRRRTRARDGQYKHTHGGTKNGDRQERKR
jgi:hypothetical protein